MITVNGGTETQKQYVASMVAYCLKKFLPRHRLDIEVDLRRMTNQSSYGYCCQLDNREFNIEVKRSLKLRTLLTTIAHEMVHVKQYVKEQLPCVAEDNVHYWDKDSEVEAHGRETGLFIRWAEENNLGHKKWTQVNE
jgi:hypothetical protein